MLQTSVNVFLHVCPCQVVKIEPGVLGEHVHERVLHTTRRTYLKAARGAVGHIHEGMHHLATVDGGGRLVLVETIEEEAKTASDLRFAIVLLRQTFESMLYFIVKYLEC